MLFRSGKTGMVEAKYVFGTGSYVKGVYNEKENMQYVSTPTRLYLIDGKELGNPIRLQETRIIGPEKEGCGLFVHIANWEYRRVTNGSIKCQGVEVQSLKFTVEKYGTCTSACALSGPAGIKREKRILEPLPSANPLLTNEKLEVETYNNDLKSENFDHKRIHKYLEYDIRENEIMLQDLHERQFTAEPNSVGLVMTIIGSLVGVGIVAAVGFFLYRRLVKKKLRTQRAAVRGKIGRAHV